MICPTFTTNTGFGGCAVCGFSKRSHDKMNAFIEVGYELSARAAGKPVPERIDYEDTLAHLRNAPLELMGTQTKGFTLKMIEDIEAKIEELYG